MSLHQQRRTDGYGCCDYHYLLGAAYRAEMLRRAERTRLRRVAGSPARIDFLAFTFTIVGKLLVGAGRLLVRLGNGRSSDIRFNPQEDATI